MPSPVTSTLRATALAAGASLALAAPARAEDPTPAPVITEGPAYITSIGHDGAYVYWGEEPLVAERKGGLFRAVSPNGKVETLWTGETVSDVLVSGDMVYFTTRMDKHLSAIPKAGGDVRLVVDLDAIAAQTGVSGGGSIEGVGRVGDRLVLALGPFGKCRDQAGAIVTVGLDGSDVKVLTRACPDDLSVDGDDLAWREWGQEKAEGGREDDTIFRMSVHDKKPTIVAKAQVYLQPVLVGGVVFYVDDGIESGGIMRVEAKMKPTRFAPNVSASLSTDGVDLYAQEQPFGKRFTRYDPKTGEAKVLVERKGLTKSCAFLGEVAYSVCELGKSCALEYAGGVSLPPELQIEGLDLEALEREMQEP